MMISPHNTLFNTDKIAKANSFKVSFAFRSVNFRYAIIMYSLTSGSGNYSLDILQRFRRSAKQLQEWECYHGRSDSQSTVKRKTY